MRAAPIFNRAILMLAQVRCLARHCGAALLVSAVLVFALYQPVSALEQPSRLVRVMIGPPKMSLRELFEQPEQWREVRKYVGALIVADHNFKEIGDEELRRWFSELASWRMQLELAVGAIKQWSASGAGSFAKDRPTWDRIRALGG